MVDDTRATMEKLKKVRTVVRTAFTRNAGVLNTQLAKERPDIEDLQARLAVVREKASELEDINRKIFEVMTENNADEVQLLQETETADEYRLRYQQVKAAVNNVLNPVQPALAIQDVGQAAHVARDMHVRTFKLPKIQLPKFIGELKDWLQFWSLFKNIHEDPTISKEDKFQYLIQSMVKDSRVGQWFSADGYELRQGNRKLEGPIRQRGFTSRGIYSRNAKAGIGQNIGK